MAGRKFDDRHHSVLPARSLGVAAFSTIVEWYDFTLYLYFATVLAGCSTAAEAARCC